MVYVLAGSGVEAYNEASGVVVEVNASHTNSAYLILDYPLHPGAWYLFDFNVSVLSGRPLFAVTAVSDTNTVQLFYWCSGQPPVIQCGAYFPPNYPDTIYYPVIGLDGTPYEDSNYTLRGINVYIPSIGV